MTNILSQLKDKPGAYQNSKRKGRGIGSGKGKTAARGIKGQKSRSGVAIKGFEGGQMPIYRRLPKRGFTNYNRKVAETVNLGQLQTFIDAKKLDGSKAIDREALIASGLVKGNKDGIKLLAKGELTAKINLTIDAASEAAIAAVKKAGGNVTLAEAKPAEKPAKKASKSSKKNTASKKQSKDA